MSSAPKAASHTEAESTAAFTAEERAAMKERAQEVRTAKRRGGGKDKGDPAAEMREKIAAMDDADREIAEKLQEIVQANAPELTPKLWYGMVGWARDGKVIVFFQDARKFKTRYATLGFNEGAQLDDGNMWATAFALTGLTRAEEKKIAALLKKIAS